MCSSSGRPWARSSGAEVPTDVGDRLSVVKRTSAGRSQAAARTIVIWEVLRGELERATATRPQLRVVDIGGGTGGFAVPLAQAGHDITVVDPSPDALAAL